MTDAAETIGKLPDCDVDEAPHLAGMIRVTVIYEDGGGETAYFDPALLPSVMQGIDRTKDIRGQTFRTRAQTIKGWAKLREMAYHKLPTEPLTALNFLLWLYFRCPDAKMRVADKIQQVLDREGMACLTIVRNRKSGTTAAAVTSRFDSALVGMSEFTMPPDRFVAIGLDGGDGPSGTA